MYPLIFGARFFTSVILYPTLAFAQLLNSSLIVFCGPICVKDIRFWSRNCLHCQRCKVYRHTTPPGCFSLPDSCFQHVHIDLVGPLPPSNGFSYIFTCVDRYKTLACRDSDPLKTVAKSFIELGCPILVLRQLSLLTAVANLPQLDSGKFEIY